MLPSREKSLALISAIYADFRDTNQWPLLRDLTIRFRAQFRVDILIDTLMPQWVVATGSLDQDGSTVALKLDALAHLPDARPDLECVVKLIACAADAYLRVSKGTDQWSAADAAKALNASPEETDRALRLVSNELRLFRASSASIDGHINWVTLGSDLLEFEGVDTPETYFMRRAEFFDRLARQHEDSRLTIAASPTAGDENERLAVRHAVGRMENILTAVATGQAADTSDFADVRDVLVQSSLVQGVLPDFVIICHTPGEFEGMMKREVGGYRERRQFISDAFAPMKAVLTSDRGGALHEPMTLVLSRYDRLMATWMQARNRVSDDPAGAITAARSLVESAFKHSLDEHGIQYTSSDDAPKLAKRYLSNCLGSVPPQSAEAVRKLYGNVTTAVHALSQMRNELGDAHGSGPGTPPATVALARLAVDVACALTLFVLSDVSVEGSDPEP